MTVIEQCRIDNFIIALRGYGAYIAYANIHEFYVVEVSHEQEEGIFHIVGDLTRRYESGPSLEDRKNKAIEYCNTLKDQFIGGTTWTGRS